MSRDLMEFKFEEERLKVADLSTDPRVQRPLNLNRVNAIVSLYNPAGLGVLSVSRRGPAGIQDVIIDGQHRREAILRVNDGGGEALCHVYSGLTLADEAELFLLLNNTTKPRLIDRHLVSVTAGDEMANSIAKLTSEYGWKVTDQAGPAAINAVGSLQKVWRLSERVEADPNLITMTLMVINRAWGTQENAARGVLMEGIAAMFAEYGAKLDTDVLIRKMAGFPGGPDGLHDRAQTYAKMERFTVPMAVARLLVKEYNVGRRAGALTEWRRRR